MKSRNLNNNRRLRWTAFLTLMGLYGNIITAVIAILKLGGVLEISNLSVLICFGIFGGLSFIAKLLIKREINRKL